MPRPCKEKNRLVQATHLKYAGVRPTTIKLHLKALEEFISWRRAKCRSPLASLLQLDAEVADCINYLYVNGDPMYRAANLLAGFQRVVPSSA